MPNAARAPREAAAGRRAAVRMAEGEADHARALAERGWRVTRCAPHPAADLPDCDVVVLASGRLEDDLRVAELHRRRGLSAALVILADAPDVAQARWLAELTSFLYPRSLGPDALAALLERLAPGRERRATAAPSRTVTVRPWESVEVDGVPVELGVAERNFLFTLSRHRGVRMAKDDEVDAGSGRAVPARECRRRLGKRLGEELASLLVASPRGEPYRFRERDEVSAECARRPQRHPPTLLRVPGRSEPRLLTGTGLAALS